MAKFGWGILALVPVLWATTTFADPAGLWIDDANDVFSSKESLNKALGFAHERGVRRVYLPVYRVGQMYFQYPKGAGGVGNDGKAVLPNAMNPDDEFRANSFKIAQELARQYGPNIEVVPWFQGGMKTLYHPPGHVNSPPASFTMKDAKGSDRAYEPNDGQFSYLNVTGDPKVRQAYIDMVVNFMNTHQVKTIQFDDHFTVQNAYTQGKDYTAFARELAHAIHDRVGPDAGYQLSINPTGYTNKNYSLDVEGLLKSLSTEIGYKQPLTIQVFRHDLASFKNTVADVAKLRDRLSAYGIPVKVAVLAEPGKAGSPESLNLLNQQLAALDQAGLPLGGLFSFKDYTGRMGPTKSSLRGLLAAVNQGRPLPALDHTTTNEIASFSPPSKTFVPASPSAPVSPTVHIAAAPPPMPHYQRAGKAEISSAPVIAMAPEDKEPKVLHSVETPVHTVPLKKSLSKLAEQAAPVLDAPVQGLAAPPRQALPQVQMATASKATPGAPVPGSSLAQRMPAPASAPSPSRGLVVTHSPPRALTNEPVPAADASSTSDVCAGKTLLDCLRSLKPGTYKGRNKNGEACTLVVSLESEWMFRNHAQPLVHFLLYNDGDRETKTVKQHRGTKTVDVKRDVFRNGEFAEFTLGQDAGGSAYEALPKAGTISSVLSAFRPTTNNPAPLTMPPPSLVKSELRAQGEFEMDLEEHYYRFLESAKSASPRWVEKGKLVRNVKGDEDVELDTKRVGISGRIVGNRVDSLSIVPKGLPKGPPRQPIDCKLDPTGAPIPGAPTAPPSAQH